MSIENDLPPWSDPQPPGLAGGAEHERFRIDVHREPDTVRVAPVGELDVAVAARLRDRLEQLHASGSRRLVLDLRGLSFIDSSGLSVIIQWSAHARGSGASFQLIPGPRAVQRPFETLGVRRLLAFRPP